jgi:3'-5' exoribonuclease
MKRQFVADLTDGDLVNDYFIAARKDLRQSQNGNKFLGMVFRDKTGDIGGIHWTNPTGVASGFEVGDVVSVKGRVQTYQERLQLKVDQVLPVEEGDFDTSDLTEAQVDVGPLADQYKALLGSIENSHMKQLVASFLDDAAFMQAFSVAAAGKRWHHGYRGGLLEHCYEMARLVDGVCKVYPTLNRDVMLAATLLHDAGKLLELTQDLAVEYTDVGKLLGHIVEDRIRQVSGFPENLRLHLLHLIVSHHGTLENGSPVIPKSREALVFSRIDDIGAQMNAWTRVIDETRERRDSWSEFVPLINQQIWADS